MPCRERTMPLHLLDVRSPSRALDRTLDTTHRVRPTLAREGRVRAHDLPGLGLEYVVEREAPVLRCVVR